LHRKRISTFYKFLDKYFYTILPFATFKCFHIKQNSILFKIFSQKIFFHYFSFDLVFTFNLILYIHVLFSKDPNPLICHVIFIKLISSWYVDKKIRRVISFCNKFLLVSRVNISLENPLLFIECIASKNMFFYFISV
jgi:hypothetical protein